MAFVPCKVGDTTFPTLPASSDNCKILQRRHRELNPPLDDDLATGGLSQILNSESDPCRISSRWLVAPEVVRRLLSAADRLPFPISIISGHRSIERQNQLRAAGRPTAANDTSTHLTCPATGADLRLGTAVTNVTKAVFGQAVMQAGLRWGGGSPVDPQTGIPSDWNHVDLGPRR